MALIADVPPNIENFHETLQEIFFFLIFVTAICGKPTPEIRFSPGQLRWTLLPKERYGDSLSGPGLNRPTFQLRRRRQSNLSYCRSNEMFVANSSVWSDVMMRHWDIAKETTIEEQRWS